MARHPESQRIAGTHREHDGLRELVLDVIQELGAGNVIAPRLNFPMRECGGTIVGLSPTLPHELIVSSTGMPQLLSRVLALSQIRGPCSGERVRPSSLHWHRPQALCLSLRECGQERPTIPIASSLSHRSGVGDFVLAIVTRDPLRERPQENQAGLSNG
jgi:hypothetical protein